MTAEIPKCGTHHVEAHHHLFDRPVPRRYMLVTCLPTLMRRVNRSTTSRREACRLDTAASTENSVWPSAESCTRDRHVELLRQRRAADRIRRRRGPALGGWQLVVGRWIDRRRARARGHILGAVR